MMLAWVRRLALGTLAVTLAFGASAACGGKDDAKTAADVKPAIDADPLALLPGAVVALVNVDARAFYESGSLGGQMAQLSEQLLPIGQEAGFVASRDVDRVTAGIYSTQGADVAAVVRGRFDAAKIDQAARTGTPSKMGAPIVASPYAGFTLYTVSNIGFVVLTPQTVVCGTETGMRRALDRLHAGAPKRELAPWIVQTVETPGAALAAAADLVNQPVANVAVGSMQLPWMQGIRAARMVGNFQPPGLNLTGSLTYGDAGQAERGATAIRQLGSLANMLAITGIAPKISGLQATVVQTDVQYQLGVDDQSLRGVLGTLPRALGK